MKTKTILIKIIVNSLVIINGLEYNYSNKQNRVIEIGSSNPSQQQLPIFKPLPLYSTDSTDHCDNPQNSYIQPFKFNNIEYVALSLKKCGIKIMMINDPTNPTEVFWTKFEGFLGSVNRITLDIQRNLLWIAHSSNNIFTIDISQQPFQAKASLISNNSIQPYFIDFIPGVKDTILLFCYSQLQIFTISSEKQIGSNILNDPTMYSFYRSIALDNHNNILNMQFSSNLKLLIIGSSPLGVMIYSLTNQADKDLNIILLNILKPRYNNLAWFQLVDSQNIIYVQLQYGGIFSYDMTSCLQNADLASCKLTLIQNKPLKSKSGQFVINQQANLLISQYRAFGFFILDISQQVIKSFQTIELINGDSQSIAFNSDETLLYCSTTFQFLIYQKSSSIPDTNKPNLLLNIVQLQEYNKHRQEPVLLADPACFFDEKRSLLYLSRQVYGLMVFKKEAPGVISEVVHLDKSTKNTLTSEMIWFQDNTILYIPQGQSGLSIIDFTDPANPIYIQKNLKFGLNNLFSTDIQCNKSKTLCTIGQQFIGILVLDTTNFKNPQLITIFTSKTFDITQGYALGNFLQNQDVLVTSIYNYGIVIIDFNDPKNPKELSNLFTDETTHSVQRF